MKAILSGDKSEYSYPAKHGRITIPVKELCNIKDFSSYCLFKDLELVKSSLSSLIIGSSVLKNSVSDSASVAVQVPVSESSKRYDENLFTGENLKDVRAINKILSGDKNAFDFLFSKYFPIIKQKYIRNLKMDKELSEDLTMEFLTKLYEKIVLGVYNQDFTVSAMVSKMSMNFLIDYTRKKKLDTFSIDKNIEFEDGNESSFELTDSNTLNGYDELSSSEMKKYIQGLIEKLDEKSRIFIDMFYFQEKSIEEMSKELDIPTGTIKPSLMRIKKRMLEMMSSDGIDKKMLRNRVLENV